MNTINTIPIINSNSQSSVTEKLNRKHTPEELKKISEDFEALLLNSMLKSMRKAIPGGGLFEKDTSHEIYEEMLDAEMSKNLSKQHRLGIAETIYNQMKGHLSK